MSSENLPFDLIGLDVAEVTSLENTYAALKARFTVTMPDADPDLSMFEVFNCYLDTTIGGSLQVNNCTLIFIRIHYKYHNAKGGQDIDVYRYQVLAKVNLDKDFGRVVIRHETFTDKVIEVIHPVELDFAEDKAFSDKFYVVTNDKSKARMAMDQSFRNKVMAMKDCEVMELENNAILIFNNIGIGDPQQVVDLAMFANTFAAHI